MKTTIEQLNSFIRSAEGENLEFKQAKMQFDSEKLTRYCVALANEGGGKLILGVTDYPPRRVVGTSAFTNIDKTKSQLLDRLHLRIDMEEVWHSDGRVVVVHVPSRRIGRPIEYRGAYWMRSGEALVPMTPDKLHQIFAEAESDFSAQICDKANFDDLDAHAIEIFRKKWVSRTGNNHIEKLSAKQLLEDAELIIDSSITYAALILFGTRKALGRHIAQAEVIFEYRSTETSLPFQQRKEYREGFFLYYDDLWNTINLRNDLYQYQDGLFMISIPSFNEAVIREAILNAVSHRDYRFAGSVFIKQYPLKIEFISPGGFPPGITQENILWKQYPRNRRIAEAFAKCGLVERSGQGANRMFEQCARESKIPPDFSWTDDYQVFLTLNGKVQDPHFLRFLEKIGRERQVSFDSTDFIILDLINREQKLPQWAKDRALALVKSSAIERVARKYILSRKFYEFTDKKGVYTRKRGLDRETNKQLLLKHIRANEKAGSRFRELREVLPSLTRDQVQKLLAEMKIQKMIIVVGKTSAASWYPPGSGKRKNV
ncbi:MAG: putative DNA binding domain-containing protein [Proteobacteria bacterium]|nr:transcriptional regulator [Desulfobacteraceae bacterium]MBU2521325.1 putative DNA binding domain-containing protein [Pseudomonadota bacterium]MBU3981500.1 putative DNA binding domain-containing protein [Pseudomonadota bacterium]MBU4013091.1 putative DNA binding domain-containing protein [Pseudomonadota bacterium]MBU4069040.1 putative DNA binding domain-containing protein [Pseudomonadota bacterium]